MACLTVFERHTPASAVTYTLSETRPTTIGISAQCDIRLRENPAFSDLTGYQLALIERSTSERGTFILRSVFKKMQVGNGLVYCIFQPDNRSTRIFLAEAQHYSSTGSPGSSEEREAHAENTLRMCDGDNVLMFHLVRRRMTVMFHIQLKIPEPGVETSDTDQEVKEEVDQDQEVKEEDQAVKEEDQEEEEEKEFCLLTALPEPTRLDIFSRLPFETRCCVLPAVCEEFFDLSTSASYWTTISLDSMSIGSFHLFESLKDDLLWMVKHLSLVEKFSLKRLNLSPIVVRVEDWFHRELESTTVSSPRFRFATDSPAARDAAQFGELLSSLTSFKVHHICIASFERSGYFPFHLMLNLKTLVIRCVIGGTQLCEQSLDGITSLDKLETLSLVQCSDITSLAWRAFFRELKSGLKVLRLPGAVKICDRGLVEIIDRCPDLEGFELSNSTAVTDKGIAFLLNRLSSLEWLILHNMPQLFGDSWLADLRELAPSLKSLDLSGNGCAMLAFESFEKRRDFRGEWEEMVTHEHPEN